MNLLDECAHRQLVHEVDEPGFVSRRSVSSSADVATPLFFRKVLNPRILEFAFFSFGFRSGLGYYLRLGRGFGVLGVGFDFFGAVS